MRMRALVTLLVAQLALPVAARTARAQGSPPPAASGGGGGAAAPVPGGAVAKGEARDRFALGLRLFDKGENAAALAEFKRAYELVPNPLVLYNIGLVYAAMDRAVDAVDALDRFLKEGGKAAAGEAGQRAKQMRDEQSKRIAQVMVVTNKPATLEIDGVVAGRTPLEQPLRLTSGAHVLAVVAPGYLPLRQEMTLAGQVIQTINLTLLPTESNVAHLALKVAVPGAEVLINGKRVGITPLGASVAVPPGEATVEVRRLGYRSASQKITLDEGASGAMTLILVEDQAVSSSVPRGRLRLTVSESVPEVNVDGVPQPAALAGVALIAGPHVVRVERGGFLPFERQVDVVVGGDTSLFVTLTPTPETKVQYEEGARARRVWGWSVLAAGALVGAGSGIYALATRNDLSDARVDLNRQLARESDVNDKCFLNGLKYVGFNCGDAKAYLQDQVDAASRNRWLATGGIGVGLATAAVGTYLLVTGDPAKYDRPSVSQVSLWGDDQEWGIRAAGRF